VTAEKLEEIFRIAGNVLNVELKMEKDTNKFRGMATVRFEHPIESVQAICILCCSFTAHQLQTYYVTTNESNLRPVGPNLFCSLAVLDTRVGHTMDVLSPFIPVLCHSD